ncbi:stage V sporulation protein AC [Ureibacillus acetophenoni]|uniref:Stage V sporulation protein AC n=1 Tax=Ureibacillus acetophenoni TaxID=614649 RepID=A0A285U045_9BACL|nr:stage V sporulation protein AC [Ureibacillus acetophenoni]SOC35113.1 stage V sporulation protein AC [Ureibacillus acetophenoni]
MQQEQYKNLEQQVTPPTPYLKNALKAFFVGGIICTIGHAITYFYIIFFDFTENTVGNPTVSTMIFLSMLLTGFGLYTKLGQFAGAGSAVPVTGFGNAVISAAIEHRTEGIVLGVGGNIFKLAGSVILFGVASAFFISLIKLILVTIGVVQW